MVCLRGLPKGTTTAKELRLVWGVEPILIPNLKDAEKTIIRIKIAVDECLNRKFIDKDEKLIIAGNFFNLPSATNMLSIFTAEDLMKLA